MKTTFISSNEKHSEKIIISVGGSKKNPTQTNLGSNTIRMLDGKGKNWSNGGWYFVYSQKHAGHKVSHGKDGIQRLKTGHRQKWSVDEEDDFDNHCYTYHDDDSKDEDAGDDDKDNYDDNDGDYEQNGNNGDDHDCDDDDDYDVDNEDNVVDEDDDDNEYRRSNKGAEEAGATQPRS